MIWSRVYIISWPYILNSLPNLDILIENFYQQWRHRNMTSRDIKTDKKLRWTKRELKLDNLWQKTNSPSYSQTPLTSVLMNFLSRHRYHTFTRKVDVGFKQPISHPSSKNGVVFPKKGWVIVRKNWPLEGARGERFPILLMFPLLLHLILFLLSWLLE